MFQEVIRLRKNGEVNLCKFLVRPFLIKGNESGTYLEKDGIVSTITIHIRHFIKVGFTREEEKKVTILALQKQARIRPDDLLACSSDA